MSPSQTPIKTEPLLPEQVVDHVQFSVVASDNFHLVGFTNNEHISAGGNLQQYCIVYVDSILLAVEKIHYPFIADNEQFQTHCFAEPKRLGDFKGIAQQVKTIKGLGDEYLRRKNLTRELEKQIVQDKAENLIALEIEITGYLTIAAEHAQTRAQAHMEKEEACHAVIQALQMRLNVLFGQVQW